MKKRILLSVFITLAFAFIVGGSLFVNNDSGDFNAGIYYRTFFNSSGFVQLNNSQGFLSGNYTSQVFDGTNAEWNNISFVIGANYSAELLNNNGAESSDVFVRPLNMTGNVLLMHLNEGSGATSFADNSGRGNDGTCSESQCPASNSSGKFSNAFFFDGSGSNANDDFITIPFSNSLNISSQIAIESWIYWYGDAGESANLQDIVANGAWNRALRIAEPGHGQANKILSHFTIGGTEQQLYSIQTIQTSKWYYVVTSYNGSDLIIYINGKIDNSAAASGNLVQISSFDDTFIGAEFETVSNFYGLIDEAAIYNRSLSAQEISDRYTRGMARLNLTVRSCDDSSCSGENWEDAGDNSPLDLSVNDNRYFQYKFDFASENESVSAELYNATIDYTILNVPPSLNLASPNEGEKFINNVSLNLNYTVSDGDGNLDSCWYNLDNGVNISLSNCLNTTFNVSNGNHVLNIFANDTQGELVSDTTNFSVDSVKPLVNLVYPSSQNYTSIQTQLNYSVFDLNLQSCKYSLNNGISNTTLTCGQNVSGLDSGQGSSTWRVYVNDSFSNFNSSLVSFFVDSIAPSLSIVHPQEITYGINTSLPLNFTVLDNGIGLDSCWFNIDNGGNKTISNCANTTFNATGDGGHTLYFFVNDSFGNLNVSNVSFTVVTSVPAINLISPENGTYFNSGINVYLNYSVFSGAGLSSCQLRHDFSGTWSLNDTKSPISNGNYFYIFNLTDGSYDWGIVCNDTDNRVSAANRSFYVDSLSPSLILSEPTGTKNSLIGIPLTFSFSDASQTQCYFNVSFTAGGVVPGKESVNIPNCTSTTFSLPSDSSYILYLTVNDSAGNINFTSSNFSVDTSSPAPPSGGSSGGSGGGGGGGGGVIAKKGGKEFDLTFGELGEIILKRGTSISESLEISNVGIKFVNNCKLKFEGQGGNWISNSQTKGLSPGEKFIFDLALTVPAIVEPGEYESEVIAECDEGVQSKKIVIVAYRNSFDFEILDYEKIANKLRIGYKLIEFSGTEHEINVGYEMLDFDGVPRFRGNEEVKLGARETKNETIEFDLPKDSFGEFVFRTKMNDGEIEVSGEKEIFLPSQRVGLTGLTTADTPGKRLTVIGVVLSVLIGLVFVFWIFKRFNSETKKISFVKKSRRKLIPLDIREKAVKRISGRN
ncbi:LamG domain-containing protein [Candidatus Pacearchaeota archaeon]|nr:LamG domain-containing protein [Candidatus Pacearchaeota archaeon]